VIAQVPAITDRIRAFQKRYLLPAVTALIVSLVLGSTGSAQAGGGHIGQLEIRAIGVDRGPIAAAEVGPWELRAGQQFVIVRLAIRNPGRYWNCTTFQALLQTDDATEHQAEQMVVEPTGQVHAIRGLSVGDRRTVRLVFRVPEQARPTTGVLQRESEAEAACLKERGHNDPSVELANTLELSLAALPARTDLVIAAGQVAGRVGDLMIQATA